MRRKVSHWYFRLGGYWGSLDIQTRNVKTRYQAHSYSPFFDFVSSWRVRVSTCRAFLTSFQTWKARSRWLLHLKFHFSVWVHIRNVSQPELILLLLIKNYLRLISWHFREIGSRYQATEGWTTVADDASYHQRYGRRNHRQKRTNRTDFYSPTAPLPQSPD